MMKLMLCFVFTGIPQSLRAVLFKEAGLGPDETDLRCIVEQDMPRWLLCARSDNTVKKHSSYFGHFCKYMNSHKRSSLPARSIDVAMYCTHLLNINKSDHVISSVIYAIKYYHNLHGYADPTDCSRVKFLQDASKRVMHKPVIKKDIISPGVIKSLFAKYHSSEDLAVIRDLAMIILSFTAFLRYDELSNLRCNDVTFHNDSYLNIHLRKSKTDVMRDGDNILVAKLDSVSCPYLALKRYISVAHIDVHSSDFLFKGLYRSKNKVGLRKSNKKLSYTRTKEVLLCRLREFVPAGLNLGLHSLRSGGASAAASSKNVNDRCWRRHGRWKSDVANGYVKESINNRLTVSKNLGI